MKAAVYKGSGQPLVIEDVPEPQPQAGELLIKVKACGICGSDLHATEHGLISMGGIPGHEFAGEIAAIGPHAAGDWQLGERVYSMPQITCGRCDNCLGGRAEFCSNMKIVGATLPGDLPGAYAEYVRAGSRNCIRLPATLSFPEGALAEPLSTGVLAIREAALRPHENVLIIGAGPIGLAIAIWARFFGAGRVAVSERVAQRLTLAQVVGATDIIDANQHPDPVGAFTRLVGKAPDVIFEAVGVRGMIQHLIEIAPRRCRIVVAGVCMQEDAFNPVDAILKEVKLNFILSYSKDDGQLAIDMMASKRINAAPLITHEIPLEALPEAFESLRQPGDQCKVIIAP